MTLNLQTQLQRYVGLDEREIAPMVSQFTSQARTLVDVGASDGYYTMGFLKSAAQRVIACEPSAVCDRLIKNAAANGYVLSNRFHVERRLVGDREGNVSLLELINGCPRPVFLKVDVEGAEIAVIRSIEGYPHLDETLWIVETHSAELEMECLEWFRQRSFEARIIYPARWRRFIPEQRPAAHNRWLAASRRET